ncbi:hypothetical protein SELMODRAFT_114449 [Selaginella moellendorffii]|uniref:Uncharacterized protein n=1 Tax=Selaginella moellendorffii TaxID=88036 RepID=D8SDA6_SELML|nr:uncharacterized protein LOC9647559 isoform X1 [Selaginella moellendorffii]EFJ17480.1 hypothetical protein SELMODRAFT_114449 [Selaginella moellendorffii]|eukprot:XP_002981292.1 uncharacterized protein LOC9647559 isoform X1 [Selaginella moellendorffii]
MAGVLARRKRPLLAIPLQISRFRALCENAGSRAGVSLIQGASRGLGLEFVRQLLERNAKDFVVATCRNPVKAENLAALKEKYPDRLQVLGLDVTDEDTIKEAANQVSKFHGPLELLVNTAGILHVENLVTPETSLSKLEKDALLLTFQINAAGPALVMKHMSPLLKSGGSREVPVIANLSARVGSIGDNKLGGWLSYRASKTALNQLTKTISIELARRRHPVACVLLHPGTVDTDLSKPYQRNVAKEKLFTKEFSVSKLLAIIDRVGMKDTGKFFAWDGQEIAW